jgi:hypothetical protein
MADRLGDEKDVPDRRWTSVQKAANRAGRQSRERGHGHRIPPALRKRVTDVRADPGEVVVGPLLKQSTDI